MSKIRLWGHPKSINVQKVLWALDELDLEFQGVDAGGKFGRVKDADYLILNPNGLVPTLEDGPLIIQLIRTASAGRDRTTIEQSLRSAGAALAILDRELSRKPFVAGEDFTFGDIPLATVAQRWFNLPVERPPANAVQAWYDRVKRRPGFRRWVDQPLS